MTSRIMMMPRMPPVSTTQSFDDIATATRIESIAKMMSVNSTFTTVAQNADRPSIGRARRRRAPRFGAAALREMLHGEVEQIGGTRQFDPPEPQAGRSRGSWRRCGTATRRGCRSAARFGAASSGKPEHEHRQNHRVVRAQQTFERDEQADRQQVGGTCTTPFSMLAAPPQH